MTISTMSHLSTAPRTTFEISTDGLCPNASVVARRDVTADLFVLRIVPDSDTSLDFKPGQYSELAVNESLFAAVPAGKERWIRRPYSIASAPAERPELEFYLTRVPDGTVSPRLWNLRVGDRLWIGPRNKGNLSLASAPRGCAVVLAATGTGIAPFISMLRHFVAAPPWSVCLVVHGVRLASELAYHDELRRLSREQESVIYLPAISREAPAEPGIFRGRLPQLFDSDDLSRIAGLQLSSDNCHVFLCGSPAMIDSVRTVLEKRGFTLHKTRTPGNIHVERYW